MEKEEKSLISYFNGKTTLFELGNSLMSGNEYIPAFSCFLKYAEKERISPDKISESLYNASLSFNNCIAAEAGMNSWARNTHIIIDLCRYAINEYEKNWKAMFLIGEMLCNIYRYTDKWNKKINSVIDYFLRGINILRGKNIQKEFSNDLSYYHKFLYIFRCLLDSCNEINYRLPDYATAFIIKWITDNYKKLKTYYQEETDKIVSELPFFTDCHAFYKFILKNMICQVQKELYTFYCENDDEIKKLFISAGKKEQKIDFLNTPDIFVTFKDNGIKTLDLLEYDFSINDFKEIFIYFNKEMNLNNAISFFTNLGYEMKDKMGTLLYFALKK